jgi:hypothetical protein
MHDLKNTKCQLYKMEIKRAYTTVLREATLLGPEKLYDLYSIEILVQNK